MSENVSSISSRVKKYIRLMKALPTLSLSIKKNNIKSIDRDFTKNVMEVCLNIIKGNVPMKKRQKVRLRRFRRIIKRLGEKRVPLAKKQKVLIQKGGAFLPLLLSIATPLISSLISG